MPTDRVDDIVLFKPLTLPEIERIVDLQSEDLRRRLTDRGVRAPDPARLAQFICGAEGDADEDYLVGVSRLVPGRCVVLSAAGAARHALPAPRRPTADVLDVIEEEKLCARANELGSRLKQKLESIRSTTPEISDIRGPGFMVAVEFANPANHEPDAGFTNRVKNEAQKRGLILLTCGVYGNVVRFLAPITIPDAHFTEAMAILEDSVAAAQKG
jgi:hypothetical protein